MRTFKAFLFFIGIALGSVIGGAGHAAAAEIKISHDGLTLNALLTEADGKTLKDGVIVIVHGTLAHNAMDTIKNLTGVLAERGLNTLAINLSLAIDNRHGMYDCKTPHRHKHMDALDEIGAWLGWLESKGSGRVVLFGHSRGGNQAARFAAENGHALLSRLILLAPATGRAGRGFEKQHGKPLADELAKAEALVKAGKGKEIMAGAGLLYCPGADVTAESFVAYYRSDPHNDTSVVLRDIKVPVQVIAGGRDSVVPDLREKVASQVEGKTLQFAIIDDAGHFFLDLYAEDVADLIEEFLAAGS